MVDVFHEWIIDNYWDRMPCACTTGILTDKEREVFVAAAAAYFYGCQSYATLKFQSRPEKWYDAELAAAESKSQGALTDLVAGGQFLREINEIAPLARRGDGPPKNYGIDLFVRVLKRDYKSMTGKNPKPPSYDKVRHKDRPSVFSALCDKWAHMLDPDLPSPILSRSGYRKIFDAALDR